MNMIRTINIHLKAAECFSGTQTPPRKQFAKTRPANIQPAPDVLAVYEL